MPRACWASLSSATSISECAISCRSTPAFPWLPAPPSSTSGGSRRRRAGRSSRCRPRSFGSPERPSPPTPITFRTSTSSPAATPSASWSIPISTGARTTSALPPASASSRLAKSLSKSSPPPTWRSITASRTSSSSILCSRTTAGTAPASPCGRSAASASTNRLLSGPTATSPPKESAKPPTSGISPRPARRFRRRGSKVRNNGPQERSANPNPRRQPESPSPIQPPIPVLLYRIRMTRLALFLASCTLLCGAAKVEILRDEYGVPHIFAATAEAAAFGSGYAQAEDRLEELLRNYRKAEGTMSEAFGKDWIFHDYRQRVWRHRAVAEQHYRELDPKRRAICEAYQAGIRKFMQEHPEQVPAWAPKLDPWQIIALGRYIIWGWPEGEAGGDLLRAGIQPDPVAYHGSNEMLLAPSRTAMHAPIAVVDPHLSWYGEFRFYEMRIYGGELEFSGAAILGLPFPSLGHNRYLSVAMTTGGPDTSDAYEEEVRDGKYLFKGQWRPLEVRTERIAVKDGTAQQIRIESTHHGPIVAHKNGKAYSLALPYADEFRLLETAWKLDTAHNLAQAKAALSGLQFMAQNIMIGTVGGDIYYVRNGRVPIRPKGCDTSRPMNGPAGDCEWQGMHRFDELVQIQNPPQGRS